MKKIVFDHLLAVLMLCWMALLAPVRADEAATYPQIPEGTPYSKSQYRNDRLGTGEYFRKLRVMRREQGIDAAISQLKPMMDDYRQNQAPNWSRGRIFDQWGFWVWHEAQFDSGRNDPEWNIALYQWIFDQSRIERRMDWVFHVSPNVKIANASASRWVPYRQILAEMTRYLNSQGFGVDPSKFRDLGEWDSEVPLVRLRDFPVSIPNGRHVVYWQRHEQKDASKPTWIDNMTIAHLQQLASEHFRQGEWQKSIEMCLWIEAWVDAVRKTNQSNPKGTQIKRDEKDSYLNAAVLMSSILNSLGLKEAQERVIVAALEKPLFNLHGTSASQFLEASRIRCQIARGEVIPTMEEQLDRLIEGKEIAAHVTEMSKTHPKLVKFHYLMATGRTSEADELLRSLRELTREIYGNWLVVEMTYIDVCLDRGNLQEVANLLPRLLQRVRRDGLKIEEVPLYVAYVRLAELSGDLGLAVRCQRELLRLLESFSMSPRFPEALAKLAELLAKSGETKESENILDKALKLAAAPNLPRRIFESVQTTAARLKQAPPLAARKGRVMLQPGNAMSMAVKGFPSRLVLGVVNVGEGRTSGVLRISGVDADLSWNNESRLGQLLCRPGAGQHEIEIELDSQTMSVFHCSADEVPEAGMLVKAEWLEDGQVTDTAEWTLQPSDVSTTNAVIDAGNYQSDGFCLIPIFHHLQSKDRELANLRVTASSPCRVELYDATGTLRMVDATGNGSCMDSGDWLAEDRDQNGAVELQPDSNTGETNFHLFVDPQGGISKDGITVKIEWLVDGKWFLAAEDRLVSR